LAADACHIRAFPRPREVLDLVESTLARIRAAGKIAGTLVIEEDIEHWSRCGAQLLHCHIDPVPSRQDRGDARPFTVRPSRRPASPGRFE
jgi:2-keto-3-deoxy-L-rhamnonate aldolase RhmA